MRNSMLCWNVWYDPEIGDYTYNWFEKSIRLFRNIDESHNDFYGLLSLAGNLLKGFVKYEEISKQYQLDFQELLKKNEKKRLEKDIKVIKMTYFRNMSYLN